MAAPTATRGRATGAVRDVRGAISHSSSPPLTSIRETEGTFEALRNALLAAEIKAPDRVVGCSVTTRGPED